MTTQQLIDHHEKALRLLENIKMHERMIASKIDSINGFAGTFPNLRADLSKQIETRKRRLKLAQQLYINLQNS